MILYGIIAAIGAVLLYFLFRMFGNRGVAQSPVATTGTAGPLSPYFEKFNSIVPQVTQANTDIQQAAGLLGAGVAGIKSLASLFGGSSSTVAPTVTASSSADFGFNSLQVSPTFYTPSVTNYSGTEYLFGPLSTPSIDTTLTY